MKPRSFLPTFLLLVTACAGSDGADDSPYAYSSQGPQGTLTDGGAPGTDGGADGIDFSAIPSQILTNEQSAALAVSALGSLLSSLVPVAHGLDVTADANANADIIAANLRAVACAGAIDSHGSDTAYLLIDLGASCTLGNSRITASGSLQVGVTTGTTSYAQAAVQLVGVKVNGFALDGFANITYSGPTQTLVTRVTIANVGIVAYAGTSVDATGGTAPALTLNGTGTFTGPTHTTPTSADGWSCMSSPTSFLGFRQMSKLTTQCFPNSGSLDVRTAYACTKGDERQTVVATSDVLYDANTTSTGKVTFSVELPTTAGGDGTPIASTTTMACLAH